MKRYFKKFSIMFVMILAVTGIVAIQNGIVANASVTIGQKLLQPENGWTRYDDTDSRILYNNMTCIYDSDNPGGSYTLTGSPSGDGSRKFSFKFYGTKLRMLSNMHSNRSNNITVTIDGISQIASEKGSGGNAWYSLWYEKCGLTLGIHQVTVTLNNADYMDLNAIDIDDTGSLLGTNETMALNQSSINLQVGDSQQLTAATTQAGTQVTWKSSDSSIAKVDSTGKVTGVKEGTCTITAKTADGLTATCTVIVTNTTGGITTGASAIVNTAHAKGDNTNNAGGGVSIIFNGDPDTTLSVVKTADVKSVYVGDTFTYTIVVTNTGTKTAKAVVVNDPAPNHIDFSVDGVITTQGTVDSSSTSKNIIVNIGDIPPSGTVTITIPATVIK